MKQPTEDNTHNTLTQKNTRTREGKITEKKMMKYASY